MIYVIYAEKTKQDYSNNINKTFGATSCKANAEKRMFELETLAIKARKAKAEIQERLAVFGIKNCDTYGKPNLTVIFEGTCGDDYKYTNLKLFDKICDQVLTIYNLTKEEFTYRHYYLFVIQEVDSLHNYKLET